MGYFILLGFYVLSVMKNAGTANFLSLLEILELR